MNENKVPGSFDPDPRLGRWDWAIRIACLLGVIYGFVGPFFPTFKPNSVTLLFLPGVFFAKKVREFVQHLLRRLQESKIKLTVKKGPLEVELHSSPPEAQAQTPHERGTDQDYSHKTTPQSSGGPAQAFASDQQLLELTKEFNDILQSQRPGENRTLAIADVTRRITRILSVMSETETRACLSTNQPITALVYLTKNPTGSLFLDVAKRLRTVDQNPFVQWWCLEIIVRILDKEPLLLNRTTLEVLHKYLPSLPVGTTRRSRLLTLIDAIENRELAVENNDAVNDATTNRSEGKREVTGKRKK
jgi:hypothetical protein